MNDCLRRLLTHVGKMPTRTSPIRDT